MERPATRQPTPTDWRGAVAYGLFDLATLVCSLLFFDRLVQGYQTLFLQTYFFVYLLFCGALVLKRWDPSYLRGLERFGERHALLTFFSVYFSGLVLGAMALGSLVAGVLPGPASPLLLVPAALLLPFSSPVLFYVLVRRASPVRGSVREGIGALLLRLVTHFIFFVHSSYMLAFVYYNLEKLRAGESFAWWVYPFVLLALLFLIALFYLPARIHLFFQEPEGWGNWLSFALTCASLTLFALTGWHG